MLLAERASRDLPIRFAPIATQRKMPLPRNAQWLRRDFPIGRAAALDPEVVISEVSAAGLAGFTDELRHSHDWVELYNRSSRDVRLEGYTLSDSRLRPGRWSFPRAIIPAGGYYLVWLSAEDEVSSVLGKSSQWPFAGFSLRRSGETLTLSDPRGRLLDYVTTAGIQTGKTLARAAGGTGAFVEGEPTPLGRDLPPPPVSDRESGFYPRGTIVQLGTGGAAGTVRCTLDGTDPSPATPACGARLEIQRATVLKARIFREGSWPGPTLIRTYWVDPPPPALLVLAVAPEDLHSPEKGILTNFAAKGPAWERPVWVTFMEQGKMVYESAASIEVQGLSTRTMPEKSFRLSFRPSWGSRDEGYPFFGDPGGKGARKLLVRAAADYITDEDWGKGWYCPNPVADQLGYAMMRACGVPAPRTRYAVIALNGEVYGVSVLTEEIDDSFFEQRYGHSDFDLSQVHTKDPLKRGSLQHYNELHRLVYGLASTSALKKAMVLSWEIPARLDMDSLWRWLSVISFAGVRDHNQGFLARDRRREDSRFQVVAYDMDSTFLPPFRDNGEPEAWKFNKFREFKLDRYDLRSRVVRALWESDPKSRRAFAAVFQELVNHRLRGDIWLPELERLAAEYREILHYQILGDAARGTVLPMKPDHRRRLEITVDRVAEFLRRRPQVALVQAGEYLGQGAPHRITLAVDGEGEVRVNGYPERHGFEGWYFPGTLLRFEARPRPGWRLLRWETGGRGAGTGNLHLTVDTAQSVKAVFTASTAGGKGEK